MISGTLASSAVTTEKLADAAVNSDKIDFSSIDEFNYETTETDTGKKWIDGSPIYRKVITGVVNLPANNYVNVPTGITGLSPNSKMINISGYMRLGTTTDSGTQTVIMPIYRELGQTLSILTFNTSTGALQFASSFAWGNSFYCLVLEYVK